MILKVCHHSEGMFVLSSPSSVTLHLQEIKQPGKPRTGKEAGGRVGKRASERGASLPPGRGQAPGHSPKGCGERKGLLANAVRRKCCPGDLHAAPACAVLTMRYVWPHIRSSQVMPEMPGQEHHSELRLAWTTVCSKIA